MRKKEYRITWISYSALHSEKSPQNRYHEFSARDDEKAAEYFLKFMRERTRGSTFATHTNWDLQEIVMREKLRTVKIPASLS